LPLTNSCLCAENYYTSHGGIDFCLKAKNK